MATMASFSVADGKYNANKLADPENLYTPGFKVLNCKLKKNTGGGKKIISSWWLF